MGGTPPEEKEEGLEGLGELLKAMAKFQDETEFEPEFPLEINGIHVQPFGLQIRKVDVTMGDWVSIRPCSESSEGKTYLGIFLGNIPLDAIWYLKKASKTLEIIPKGNPAIYVPDLKRVVFGCESFWGKIDSPEDLKQITDQDIQNIWYVKALKEIQEKEEAK